MQTDRKLVATFEISDDANEDQWAQGLWQAELAAKEAATESGVPEDEVAIARHGRGVVAARPDGQEFEARLRTNPKLHRVALPRRLEPPAD